MVYIFIAALLVLVAFFYMRGRAAHASKYANISVGELQELMKSGNLTLIDVRTQKEIQQGVIGKPLQIELGPTMEKRMRELDRSKKYVLYCRSGRRSALASDLMAKLGFGDVNNLLGGYNAWKGSN